MKTEREIREELKDLHKTCLELEIEMRSASFFHADLIGDVRAGMLSKIEALEWVLEEKNVDM